MDAKISKKFTFKMSVIIYILLLIVLFCLLFVNDLKLTKTLLFLLCYFVLTIFYIVREKNNIVNIKTIFIALYTLLVGLSPLFYCLNYNTFNFPNGTEITYQYILILIGYLMMIIGFYIPIKKKKSFKKNINYSFQKKFALVLLIVSTLANTFYIFSNRAFFFSGNLNVGRIEALSSNGVILVLTNLYIIGIGLLYDYFLNTKKSLKTLIFFIVMNIVFFIIRGSRSQILNIFMLIVLLYNHYKNIKPGKMLRIALIFLILISCLRILRNNVSGTMVDLVSSTYDTLQVGSININYIYNVFPSKIDFQHGSTFLINLKMLLPGPDLDFTLWLKQCIGLEFSGGGVTPTVIGEGYINFGIFGIIIIMLFTGILGNILNHHYFNNNKGIAWICVCLVYIFSVFKGGYCNIEVILLTILFTKILYMLLYNNKLGDNNE